jgi:hypothetical protein
MKNIFFFQTQQIPLLNYVQHLDFEIKYIDQISYRVVGFRLQDFLRCQNKYNNQYQLRKVKEFFEEVQTRLLLTSFSDNYFRFSKYLKLDNLYIQEEIYR